MPPPLHPLIELEIRRQNERVADDDKPMVSIVKALDQLLSSKVRSTISSTHIFYEQLLSKERRNSNSNTIVFLSSRPIETRIC